MSVFPVFTQQQADAAVLRAVAQRCESRGEVGIAALVRFTASLVQDCVPLPLDLVQATVAEIAATRMPES